MAEFKDATAPKKKTSGKYPWDFKAPSYDNRTSSSISAGNDYGSGVTTPVGLEKAGSLESGPIPQKAKCWNPHETVKADIRG